MFTPSDLPKNLGKEEFELKNRKWVALIALIILLNLNLSVFAEASSTEPDPDAAYVIKDSVVTTSEQLDNRYIEKKVTVNGKDYKLDTYSDDVVQNYESLQSSTEKENLLDKKWTPTKTISIKHNDNEVSLTLDSESITYVEDDLREEAVEVTETYYEGEVPESVDYEYTDPVTEKTVHTTLELKEKNVTDQEWVNGLSIPLTIYDYDAEYYLLNNTEFYIGANGQLDISGKESAILGYLNLSSERNRITGVQWSNNSYVSNGTVCRQALAYGQRLINVMTATYQGIVTCPVTYTGIATYKAEIPDGTYTHNLIMYYTRDYTKTVITVSVFLLIFIILIVTILFIVKRKSKKEKNA